MFVFPYMLGGVGFALFGIGTGVLCFVVGGVASAFGTLDVLEPSLARRSEWRRDGRTPADHFKRAFLIVFAAITVGSILAIVGSTTGAWGASLVAAFLAVGWGAVALAIVRRRGGT